MRLINLIGDLFDYIVWWKEAAVLKNINKLAKKADRWEHVPTEQREELRSMTKKHKKKINFYIFLNWFYEN